VYAAMDIFILPSAQPEPFGGVVMEAMSLGLPAIGTAIGGTIEQIADGETGILVPPADPDAIAHAISKIASDHALCVRMGVEARQRVLDRFSLNGMVAAVEQTYRSCLRE
jgi:glycosyltransferase involved in cell wall biosynthesis